MYNTELLQGVRGEYRQVKKEHQPNEFIHNRKRSTHKRLASTLSAIILRIKVRKTGPPPPMKSNSPVSQRSCRFDCGDPAGAMHPSAVSHRQRPYHGRMINKLKTRLTDRDHEEHGGKRTKGIDDEDDPTIHLFGKYGIRDREQETLSQSAK